MNNEQLKILLIDDEKFYIDVLVDTLQDDYNVCVATSGAQGLQRVQSDHPPDLVLLDILMPEMDGYEVCRRLKENMQTSDIPVIFLTVKGEVDDEVRGFESGAVDYITKPISPPIVRSRVRTHLMLAKAKQILMAQNFAEIEVEKLKIYKAMLTSTNHILNNFLQSMLFFKMTAEESQNFSPEVIKMFEDIIYKTSTKIKDLGNLSKIDEKSILSTML